VNARSSSLSPASPRGSRRGFALLVVVTLLAFIVLLLVGLASYTRIETAAAGNTQRQAQAREHALLALNLAVAQLQRHAGPDQRVTATAEATASGATARYTGVWAADPADDDDANPLTPLAWLASGNELRNSAGVLQPRAVPPGAPMNANNAVALVGANTSRVNNDVMARLVPVTVPGVPGSGGAATTIGRYAWWVGDQGVKAPVAVPDTSTAATYAPYDSADLRARVRQQVTAGAGAATTAGAAVFEPRDNNNATLVAGEKILQQAQTAFLKNSGGSQLGFTTAQSYFHAWSPNTLAVLADTRRGGLKRDLSLDPTLLGEAFAAWANYKAYTEDPAAPAPESGVPPSISPAYGSDPVRRRHVMTPHVMSEGGSHQVAPVVNYFLITFNVRTVGGSKGNQPLEVRARWMVSLWNPYTSALVPEDLRVEVSGLPSNIRVNNVSDDPERARPLGSFSLGSAFGNPLRLNLPWTSNEAGDADRQSWLPGRVYTWRSIEDTTKPEDVPSDGFPSYFYSQTLNDSGAGVIRPLGLAEVDGDDPCALEVEGEESLRIELYVMRRDADGNAQPLRLSSLISPSFVQSFTTTPQAASADGYQFSYVFRLAESKDTPDAPGTWLMTTGRDVRRRSIPSECYVVPPDGNDPSTYVNYSTIRDEERLIDRNSGSRSYEKDTPVFELPRAPILSMGMLQHFRQPGQRPFMIGNPWGAGFEVAGFRTAELFDRFFLSGLVEGVTPAKNAVGDLIMPNPLHRVLRKPAVQDLRSVPDARSSRFLLQAGAFNVNSVNAAAWAAVLRGVRFPSPQSFSYLNLSESTGTAADTQKLTVQSSDAQFFRFSQSAQETYQLPGSDNYPFAANHLFRRGMRTLTAAQVGTLSGKIVAFVRAKHAESGPFRSLEEFLSPATLFAGGTQGLDRSLLEAAIEDAGLNGDFAEFGTSPTEFPAVQMNSQWLTQADILTALAPVLTPRSDTFLVRTYGEAVNPATNATEGRAWCEAVVQRVPEYLDAADAPEVLPADLTSAVNRAGGRKYKVISFRWLTRADI
jgi:hypothetical protein